MHARYFFLFMSIVFTAASTHAQQDLEVKSARAALEQVVHFFRTQVAVEGSYLWAYSSDLALREGENEATATQGWVQPPGTPSVGFAYLRAFERTGEAYLLEAARETGMALVKGQLQSGGWNYVVDFDPAARAKTSYRVEPRGDGSNTSTLDDNTSQEALAFLIALDLALAQKDAAIHECVLYALDALLAAQYPNGAWPQRFKAPPVASEFPVKKAEYPESWPREFPKVDYMSFYTFNDSSIADTMELMLAAWDAYKDERFKNAALKAGDFMLLAQMPAPQPAWAQQYNRDMHPAWARKFEPPAISGHESQSILHALLVLTARTGETRFLDAVPQALAYLRASQLPDGRLARFYELHTNKPLFFTQDYVMTYDGSNVPTHYSFYTELRADKIETLYEWVKAGKALAPPVPDPGEVARAARRALETLDARGAWLSDRPLKKITLPEGAKTISCSDFIHNVDALSNYIALRAGKTP